MRPRSRSRAIQLIGLCAISLLFASRSHGSEQRVLQGHVPPAAKTRAAVGHLAAEQKMKLVIGLPLRNRHALDALLQEIYDPASSRYGQYLTPEQFTQRFGPTEGEYQKVIEFARGNHLTITAAHPNRMVLDVAASVTDIENAFRVNLLLYPHPSQARTFYAANVEPTSPADVPILHISGLNNFLIPHPAALHPVPARNLTGPIPQAGAGPAGAYRGTDFRGAYTRGVSLNGAGQMVGLLEFDGYYLADIASYLSQASLPDVPILNVNLDDFDGTPGPNNVEAALDIEMVCSIAPGVAQIIVYQAGPQGSPNDILNRMATDNLAKQLSASWTYPIDATTEQIFLQFAAQGQSFFNASGDSGAYFGIVDTPADDPNITIVGGTVLTTTGPGGAWVSESVWDWGGTGRDSGSTGGGFSTVYPIPNWQQPVDMSANGGSTTMRNLPDVAAVADNVWVTYDNGGSQTVGGTSCSSPLWAGFMALVNQQSAAFARPPVGFLNPAVYRLGLAAGYLTNFHDVTVGSNTNSTSPNGFFAVPGYDLCTGWGSPFGQALINALAPRFPFPVITNTAAALMFEGCAPSNATVDPGETVTVNLGLKNVGGVKTTNLVAVLRADDGVLWPSSPQSYGALAPGGAALNRGFTFTANGPCGGALTATLELQDGSANLGSVTFNFVLGKPVMVLTQNFDTVTAPSLPSEWTTAASDGVTAWGTSASAHDSAPNAAFADEPPSVGIEELFSPPIAIVSPSAQLSFRNNFNTETDPGVSSRAFDGGLLEIRIGTNEFEEILAAGGSFISGGYNRTISTETNSDSPFKGRQVWGGNSGGFITTTVQLPAAAASQTIQLKWRFGLDSGNFYGGSGWYIDGVAIRDGANCCSSSADLAVAQSVAPEPVAPGEALTYSIALTNAGPGSAFSVIVTNVLPSTVLFVSGSSGCVYTNGTVLCDAGTLTGNAVTNYIFVVTPTTLEPITNATAVGSVTWDPELTNNSSLGVSTVATGARPVVQLQRTNALAVQGAVAILHVDAFGAPPLIYQWLFNGEPLVGQTASTIALTNVQPEQAGAYSVVVTNVNGATTSPVVHLTIVVPAMIQLVSVGSGSDLSLLSTEGLIYTLEYKDALSDPIWTPIPPVVPGTGGLLSFQDTNALTSPARFYRVTATQ